MLAEAGGIPLHRGRNTNGSSQGRKKETSSVSLVCRDQGMVPLKLHLVVTASS